MNESDEGNLKGFYAVNGLIIGLRWVYHEAGHDTSWSVEILSNGELQASGNPLEGNMYISNFHKRYVRKLSSLLHIPKSADPVTTEHVIEHGRHFFLTPSVDPFDLLLHAFF